MFFLSDKLEVDGMAVGSGVSYCNYLVPLSCQGSHSTAAVARYVAMSSSDGHLPAYLPR